MRTIIDIPDAQLKILNQLSQKKKVSRAEIIRQALKVYISNHIKNKEAYKTAFGIWKDQKTDGVVYQQNLRKEWSK